jgi:DNA-binding response OmpR family regulator
MGAIQNMLHVNVTLLSLSLPSPEGSLELLRLNNASMDFGFQINLSTNPVELAKVQEPGRSTIVVIDGHCSDEYDVYALISILRCTRGTGIIMLTDHDCDAAARSRALQSGADLCLPCPVDIEKFRSAVYMIARRCTAELCIANGAWQDAATPKTATPKAALADDLTGMWRLSMQGWILHSPDGVAINLTGAERTLMLSLLSARHSITDHKGFLAQSGQDPAKERHQRQLLSSTVSRLKKKWSEKGIHLPIFSYRNKGYQFDAHGVIEE